MVRPNKETILKSATNAACAVAVLAAVAAVFYSPLVEPFGYRRATAADFPKIGAILLLVASVGFVVGLVPRGNDKA